MCDVERRQGGQLAPGLGAGVWAVQGAGLVNSLQLGAGHLLAQHLDTGTGKITANIQYIIS